MIALSSKTDVDVSPVWVIAARVFTPLIVALIAGNLSIEDYVRNSFIRSGK